MKKLIGSMLVMLMGLMFSINASAGASAAGLYVQPWAFPALFIMLANEAEYKACNDKPYTLVKHADGKSNYTFDVDQCTLQDNPSTYKVQ